MKCKFTLDRTDSPAIRRAIGQSPRARPVEARPTERTYPLGASSSAYGLTPLPPLAEKPPGYQGCNPNYPLLAPCQHLGLFRNLITRVQGDQVQPRTWGFPPPPGTTVAPLVGPREVSFCPQGYPQSSPHLGISPQARFLCFPQGSRTPTTSAGASTSVRCSHRA